MSKISIIIPCYYNEENIPVTTSTLLKNESNFPVGTEFEYIFVDDGSKDNTHKKLIDFKSNHPGKVRVIRLSRNFGSYMAILAGMEFVTGNCAVVLSADLQDPPSLIPKMFSYWQKGIKLVLANRQDREDSFFSKFFSSIFYFFIRNFALKNLPKGGFDFCLFDINLCKEVLSMNEKNTNTLYLLLWLKHDYVSIPYKRNKREIGTSKWTISKKIKLWIDSFISFSFLPIRLITIAGFLLGIAAVLYGIVVFILKITGNIFIEGWTAMMLVFLFISAFQMIAIGILGEYLWRTLDASRNRPNYVIEKVD